MTSLGLEDIAAHVIRRSVEQGATGAECTVSEGEHFSVGVRMGEVETLTEAGSRAVGVRVLVGSHTGAAYTSDLTEEGLAQMVHSAMQLAKITSEDPHAGLPDPTDLGKLEGDLKLFSESIANLETDYKIEHARTAEAAALSFDPRITNSEGASFDSHLGRTIFANSLGFLGSYRTSSCSLSAVPIAKSGESMERDYWYSFARGIEGLEEPEDVGRQAARRAVRRLGARKVPTQKVPVIFEPRIARSLLDHLFEGISGNAIYRRESFLAGKLGQTIAASRLTVIDDGTLPGLFGSSPFDDEGVASRRTVVVEDGVLSSYLLNTYTARKLGMKTTGSASRGVTGNAGVGHGNFYIPAGETSPENIVRSVRNGFYVTELMGMGVSLVTGDYSRGAAGLWIENGELSYAVSEVTIASTLPEILHSIEAIGSDLEFRGAIASPTLLIGQMTVSGH